MNERFRGERGQEGFTLLEVIVTIVIAAVMGVFLIQFMGTAMLRSGEAVVRVQDVSTLRHIVDSMTSDYKYLAATQANFLSTFKTRVDTPGYYGSGYTATTRYIDFDGSRVEIQDTSAPYNLLKVTVTKGNQSFTTVFAQ